MWQIISNYSLTCNVQFPILTGKVNHPWVFRVCPAAVTILLPVYGSHLLFHSLKSPLATSVLMTLSDAPVFNMILE